MLTELNKMTTFSYHSHITDCLIGSPILDISTLFSRKFTMVAEYSCILKELLGDGWVRLGGGERRGGGVGRLIEGEGWRDRMGKISRF